MAKELARDRKARKQRTWEARAEAVLGEPVPELWPELHQVLFGLADLGQDANGRFLLSEAELWFRAHCVDDAGARDAFLSLWRVVERTTSDELRRKRK